MGPVPGKFSFTFFSTAKTNKGDRKTSSWPNFYAKGLAVPKGNLPKDDLPAWSPATFKGKRSKENVEHVWALGLDYDNKWTETLPDTGKKISHCVPDSEIVTLDEAAKPWPGLMLLGHTSSSHSKEWPKSRLVVPFSRGVTGEEYGTIWEWAADHLENFDHMIDEQCKDPSRLWYWPNKTSEDFASIFVEGQALDVDAILASLKVEG